MKLISKFLTVAALTTALASCTDDLGSAYSGGSDGDMRVTLEQFDDQMTRLAAKDSKLPYGLQSLVFSENELVRVFTLDKLSQDIYKIKSGAGTNDGVFTRTQATGLTGQKYAITEAQMVYGISAAEDGDVIKPRLTLTLPREWTPGSETINGTDFQKFPIPNWGAAEVTGEGDDANIKASLKHLTAYLRIQVNELPENTKAIVLTTHGTGQYNMSTQDGFLLAKHGAAITDTKDWWYAKDGDVYKNAEWIEGGYSEALTGTLNCFLESDNEKAKEVVLKIDERLVNHDEMIINLEGNKNQIVYVPIVCGFYKNLHVIAASAISKNYRYCYAGTELKVFQDQTFLRGKPYFLNMNLVDLGETNIANLNKAIKEKNTVQGMTTIINVDLKKTGKTIPVGYNDDRIFVQGPGSLVLNINSIASDYSDQFSSKEKALEISDKSATKGDFNEKSLDAPLELDHKTLGQIHRSVIVNFPSKWGDATADLDAFSYVDLATYTAILGTSDREKAAKLSVDVLGPTTQFNETIELQFNNGEKVHFNKEALDNESQYAIRVKEGFKNVNILRGNLGDLLVHTDGLQAIGETEVDSLDIQDQENINIRLQDALIGAFKFSKTTSTKTRNVFTLGSTAIKKVYNSTTDAVDAAGNLFKKADIEKNGTDFAGDDTNTPYQVVFRAYWTGAALSEYAIEAGYDVETVYTAAQLASVGEGLVTSTNSNHGIGENKVEPKIQSYYIPKALVRGMWLGDNIYPWIGAQATVKHFAFDGEKVELKNMTFLEEWDGASTYIDDPHWCCTSCWKPDITGSKIKIGDNIGLFRSVINSDSVLITRINLNDVLLKDETNKHNNVGAVVGKIDAKMTYLLDNIISEDKISMNGDSIGGMAGYIKSSEKLIVKDNRVLGSTNNSGYVKSKLEYVGGAIGYAGGPGCLTDTVAITDNIVRFTNPTVSTISGLRDVAGFVGNLTARCPITVLDNAITVTGNIEATGKFTAGGFAGHIDNKPSAKKEIIMNDNTVTVTKGDIKAAQHQAAGMVGRYDVKKSPITMLNDIVSVETGSIIAGTNYAGGLIAHLHSDENVTLGDVIDDKVSVSVKTKIQAKDQFAGGLVGWSELEGKSDTLLVLSADVTTPIVEAINGYVGGEIGQGAMGTYIFGADYDDFNEENLQIEQNVNISTYLSGKYGVGGLLGHNASSNATPVFVLTGKTPHNRAYSHIVVNVKSFNQTKKVDDFNKNEKNMFGTMSNILGYMQDDITFSGTKFTNPDGFDENYYLDVTDNLTGALKTKLLYKYHGGQTHTAVNDPTQQLYWGDNNGLVGWRSSGIYYLDPATVSPGEATDVEEAHNVYRENGVGGATYNSYKSILQ
jgi:hypothetical protein